MVIHYQRMFGVKWVGGIYASMSHVAMTLEETQNILKIIKEFLHLGEPNVPLCHSKVYYTISTMYCIAFELTHLDVSIITLTIVLLCVLIAIQQPASYYSSF